MYIKLKEYYIDNTSNVEQEIFLEEEVSCGIFEDVSTGQTLGPNEQEVKITFPNDGTYKVKLGNDDNGIAKNYIGLFTSMITYLEASLCGLKGGNCKFPASSTGQEENYANIAYSKLILYSSVNTPDYDASTLLAFEKIRCALNDTYRNLSIQEKLVGKSDHVLLSKMEMAYLYLKMYEEDEKYEKGLPLSQLYNYETISYCIVKLGITLDAVVCPPPPGVLHTHAISSTPSIIPLGEATNVSTSFTFYKNGDIFSSLTSTTVLNLLSNAFDSATHFYPENNPGQTKEYNVKYKYERGGQIFDDEAKDTIRAYSAQWYGGETTQSDLQVGSTYTQQKFEDTFSNINAKIQSSSNSTSSNSNTQGSYIYWVTNAPIRFFVGMFEIPQAAWDANCNPLGAAIITKKVNVTMKDGTTTQDMYLYRTCPLQYLDDQVLTYSLIQ